MTSWNVQCYSVWEVFSCMSVEFAILVHQFWLCRDIPSTLDTHHSWLTHSPGLWCLQLPTSTTVLQGASFSVAPHEPETHPRMYLWVKAYVNISFYQELADCSAEWGSNFTIMLAVARFSFFSRPRQCVAVLGYSDECENISYCCFNVCVSSYYGSEHLFYCWPFEFSFLFVFVHMFPLPLLVYCLASGLL